MDSLGQVIATLFAKYAGPLGEAKTPADWLATRSGVHKRSKSKAKESRKARKRQRRGW